MFSSKRIFSALGAAALLATIVVADPPARVARINYLQGPVSLQRGDLDEWDQAAINSPMVANDSLWTDDHARAELHIGSTALRLADQTSISFLNLNDQVVQIRLAKGVVELHLNRLDPEESYEIDTPCASASLSQTGDYRLEVDEAGDATIITRHGQAEVTVGQSTFDVAADQQANVVNSADPICELSPPKLIDDFERWANERTRREEQCVSARYVSREMIGYEDLDAYGGWTTLPEYGNAWAPYSVPAGWAPYSAGNWLWLEPYGWTWVDVEPWGFAPFAPALESLLVRAGHGLVVARPPDFVRDSIVRTRLAPAPHAIPFAARRSALTANPGRPLDAPTLGRIRGAAPNLQGPRVMPTRPVNLPNLRAPELRLIRPINPPLAHGPEPRFEAPVSV